MSLKKELAKAEEKTVISELKILKVLMTVKLVHSSRMYKKEIVLYQEDPELSYCIKRKLLRCNPVKKEGEVVCYEYALTEKGELALKLMAESFSNITK